MKDTYSAHHLIDACETFFRLNATLQFELVAFLVPRLESLVELAHKMSTNLVIYHTVETSTAVLGWVSDIDARFSCLRIVCHTCRRNLIRFEVNG